MGYQNINLSNKRHTGELGFYYFFLKMSSKFKKPESPFWLFHYEKVISFNWHFYIYIHAFKTLEWVFYSCVKKHIIKALGND